jgi:dienelactone hydrolase
VTTRSLTRQRAASRALSPSRLATEFLPDGRWLLFALALVLIVVGLSRFPPIRTIALSAGLASELLDLPLKPLSASTGEPSVVRGAYGIPADRMDLYIPAGATAESNLPGVVLALGVHPQPIDHPDVVRIAQAISRAGVVVGVPDSTPLRNLVLTPAEPGHLADAFAAVRSRPEVDPSRVGITGFSAGASIGLLAAADPRIADDVSFVSVFGGYASAEELLVDVITNTCECGTNGEATAWAADPRIRDDITTLLTGAADTPSDTQAVADLLAATDRQAAQLAIEKFSAELRANLASLSPINSADEIAAPVFILHGEPDSAIPVSHASQLANAIGDNVVRLTRFGRFGHGQPGANGLTLDDAGDIGALTLYLRDIVAAVTEP